MFEDLIKQLKQLDGMSFSVPIEKDDKGYIDKQCPFEKCEFLFKVNYDDWKNIFSDEAVWCPLCRHEALADQWYTFSQIEHSKSEAFAAVEGKIDKALRSGAKTFNRGQPKNSFISMTMKVGGVPKRTHTIPSRAAEEMQLEIKCEKCESRFAVIGSAFFCPSCGYNSVTRTYADALRKIKVKKDHIEIVRRALTEYSSKDEAEITCRSMLETCISDGVTAFQKYCEGLYADFDKAAPNVFQRLNQGSDLWKAAIQKGYDNWLTDLELNQLNILFQKRHILLHNEGMVDLQYIKKSGDSSYKEGQRIVVSSNDIDILLKYLEKISMGIKESIDEL